MKNVLFTSAWTDVIFAGRNKLYGAYVLRKEQEKNTIAALFIMVGSFAFLFCGFKGLVAMGFFKAVTIVKIMPENVFLDDYKYPDEVYEAMKGKQPIVKTPAKAAATAKSFSTDIVSTPASTPADNAPFVPSADATATPSSLAGESSGPSDGSSLNGPANAGVPHTESEGEGVGRFAEFMPVFPGNLNSYLASNIHYPSSAINAGTEGKLLVEVIINEQGKVISAVVVKSLGFGLDEEALRVVRSMPAWTPARMGTTPVKVKLIIPIKFKLG